ncbi:MAG: hypothetical protein H7Y60_09190 [Rhodospirillaceae bacterium]|nr:hypothetical protein [Rhodospirillales bacterium]
MSGHTSVEAYLAAHPVTREPDWGALQETFRTLQSFGYLLSRRRNGHICVDGHRSSAKEARALAAKLQAGGLRWQRCGRAS